MVRPGYRKPMTFYPTESIKSWLDGLPNGDKSRAICETLEKGLTMSGRFYRVPLNFYQMQEVLAVLEAAKHPLHEYFESFVL